jgi:GNAT acetyltransferase-like protein
MNTVTVEAIPVATEAQRQEWNELASRSAAGSMFQCLWWAEPQAQYGVSVDVLGCWKGRQLIGGALFRSIPVPYLGVRWTECIQGPIFAEYHPGWEDAFVRGVKELARKVNSISVVFRSCQNRDVHRDLVQALGRAQMRTTLGGKGFEGVLWLKDRTIEDLEKNFNRRTKRSVKKAQAGPIRVASLTTSDELRLGYEAWKATQTRKGLSQVPPWPALEPVLRHCVDNGLGAVLGTFLDDRILGSVFATYIGETASFVYGGYMDWAESHPAAHILHYLHIQQALARGMHAYSFGYLDEKVAKGVYEFKLGFGVVAQEQTAKITWERKPSLYRVIHSLRHQRMGRTVGQWLRYRTIDTRSVGAGHQRHLR